MVARSRPTAAGGKDDGQFAVRQVRQVRRGQPAVRAYPYPDRRPPYPLQGLACRAVAVAEVEDAEGAGPGEGEGE